MRKNPIDFIKKYNLNVHQSLIKVADVVKVAYRVQIWKKIFCQNSDKFGYSFIKNTICLCIYMVFTKNALF